MWGLGDLQKSMSYSCDLSALYQKPRTKKRKDFAAICEEIKYTDKTAVGYG